MINLSSVTNSASPMGEVNLLKPVDNGLRSAWQWLAMLTMLLDHLGFLYYDLIAFRYIGRLGMPLYAMLFVMSIQSGRVNHKRLLILALISQVPYLLIFEELNLNIIVGFYIFYWLTAAVKHRSWLGMAAAFAAMWIPVSYSWYLYASLAAFYWLDPNPGAKRSGFALLTVIYTYLTNTHLRQLLAIVAPFLQGIKAPRPPKYLYRYFYPGHLFILLIIDFLIIGVVITPFGTFPKPANDESQWYNEYYDENAPVEMYEEESQKN